MSHKTRGKTVLLALIWLPATGCGYREMIPTSELKEIRRLAFDEATKRYVLSDTSIDSQYEIRLRDHLKAREDWKREVENRKSKVGPERPLFDIEGAEWTRYGRVLAIAAIKGVQLTPSAPTLCGIKFDFEPNHNAHAQSPPDEATAERFERADGSHYWVVVWK